VKVKGLMESFSIHFSKYTLFADFSFLCAHHFIS